MEYRNRIEVAERQLVSLLRESRVDHDAIAALREEDTRAKVQMEELLEAFRSMRNALYAVAGTIAVTAMLIIIFGKHP